MLEILYSPPESSNSCGDCLACRGSFDFLLMNFSKFSNITPKNLCKSLIYKAFIMLESLTFNSNITRKSLIYIGVMLEKLKNISNNRSNIKCRLVPPLSLGTIIRTIIKNCHFLKGKQKSPRFFRGLLNRGGRISPL